MIKDDIEVEFAGTNNIEPAEPRVSKCCGAPLVMAPEMATVMCEKCGCRERTAIGELYDYIREHGEDAIVAELSPAPAACCENEDRTMNGGCRNCGDPSY